MGVEKEKIMHIGFRLPQELHDKIVYVAEYEGRTLNGQIRFLMGQCIREFEKEHGPITAQDMGNAKF